MEQHSKAFFGKSTALIINGKKYDEDFFFNFIKKKKDGAWEKPSQQEGKVVKFSLEEMISIKNVLFEEKLEWTGYHSFGESKTPLSVKWSDDLETLWINAGDYSKALKNPEVDFLKLLLNHMVLEKIEFGTGRLLKEYT